MREIKVKGNISGLKVYINDIPNLKQVPKDIADTVIMSYAVKITDYKKQYIKKK